jgi:ferrous iron transport protein B
MSKKSNEILVAVAGQPNSGKSTIFNCLTGARQFVANYPGITVEKKTGIYYYKGDKVVLVDLPGTYSLTSYSLEERTARDFLLHENPALILDIVDASNLERNLYLTFQLLEMDIPLVIALNMMDVAQRRGLQIDTDELSRQLGVAIVPTIANKGKGKEELRQAIWETYKNINSNHIPFCINYGKTLESILTSLEKQLSENPNLSKSYSTRWLAVKLLGNDGEVQKLVSEYSATNKNKEGK